MISFIPSMLGKNALIKGDIEKTSNNVKVVVRCRPMNEAEKKEKFASVIQCESSRKEVSVQINNEKAASYYFDRVFDHTASQEFVYRSVVADSVEDAIQGLKCTIFAYGQTGTGKTFTMEGKRSELKDTKSPFWYGDDAGMIPRAAQHIFQRITACGHPFRITVSYIELYNNEIIDLLTDKDKTRKPLAIRTDEGKKGCSVVGLKQVKVTSPEDIFKILEIASQKRNVAETLLNDYSSRSHCIFTLTIQIKETSRTGESTTRTGKLNLVDLAGSENTKRSGVEEMRKKEATMINKSLLSLRRVITALAANENYVPFRDSNLTRLLQESLGGKSKTCMIATISTAENCLEETRSTLQYAFSAKSIKNAPVVNQKITKSGQLEEYKAHINALQGQLAACRSEEGFYVDQSTWDDHLTIVERLTELQGFIAEKDELIVTLQKQCDSQAIDLELSKKKIKQLQFELFQAHESLQEISNTLESCKTELEEKMQSVKKEQKRLANRQKESDDFTAALQETHDDAEVLQRKVETRVEQFAMNKKATEEMLENLTQYLNCLQNVWNTLDSSAMTNQIKLLGEFTKIEEHFVVLHDKMASKIMQCNQLLDGHLDHFHSLQEQTKEICLSFWGSVGQQSTAMCTSTLKHMDSFSARVDKRMVSLLKRNKQHNTSLCDILHSSTEIAKESATQSKELLDANEAMLDLVTTSADQCKERQTKENEEYLKLIEIAREKYTAAMAASRTSFMDRVAEIFDRNVEKQNEAFETSLLSFTDSLNDSFTQTTSFHAKSSDLRVRTREKQNEQKQAISQSGRVFQDISRNVEKEIRQRSKENEVLLKNVQGVVREANENISDSWNTFTEQSIVEVEKENVQELTNRHAKALSHIQPCTLATKTCKPQFDKPLTSFKEALEGSVLPKKLNFSERKIKEHIQTQLKHAAFLLSQIESIKSSIPAQQESPHPSPTGKKRKSGDAATSFPFEVSPSKVQRCE